MFHVAASRGRAGSISVATGRWEQDLLDFPARNEGEHPKERAYTRSSQCFPQKPHGPLPWALLLGTGLWEEAASEPCCIPVQA